MCRPLCHPTQLLGQLVEPEILLMCGALSLAACLPCWHAHLLNLPRPFIKQVSAFAGPGVEAKGFGPVPDVDTLCR